MNKNLLNYTRDFFKIFSPRYPGVLYHYTSGDTLKAILDKKNLRAGHIKYMNDYTELASGRKIIIRAIKKFFNGKRHQIIANFKDEMIEHFHAWDSLSEDGDIDLTYTIDNQVYDIHVVSLSELPDVLSQWRGYADNAKGYSIGLNTKPLQKCASQPNCGYFLGLSKVIYKDKDLEDAATTLLNDWEVKVAKIKPPFKAEQEANWIRWNHLELAFALLASIFKQEGFREEKEWRLIFSRKFQDYTGLETYVKDSTLIPFISIPIGSQSKIIKQIWCGPKQQNKENKNLLEGYSKAQGFNIESVEYSKVSFR